jgi:glycosyltransferase involved in cell wall biosynthesis
MTRACKAKGGRTSNQVRKPSLLLLFDPRCFEALSLGREPTLPYSHDKNLLLLAHEALRLKSDVYIAAFAGQTRVVSALKIEQVYPYLVADICNVADTEMTVVTSSGVENLLLRDVYPEAIILGVVPALHMIESPHLFDGEYVLQWLKAARHHVDYFVTQNDRMRGILSTMVHWLVRWDPHDRTFVAPLGFASGQAARLDKARVRKDLGISEGTVLLVSAGGAWPWTDLDTLAKAMVLYAEQGGSSVRLYLPGLTQPDNDERNLVADNIKSLAKQYPQHFSDQLSANKTITIEADWSSGGRNLPKILAASDLGVNLNKEGLESWQSHRVRFVDYLFNGLPVLSTIGCTLSEQMPGSCKLVDAGSVRSYVEAIRSLESDPNTLDRLSRQAQKDRVKLDSSNTYGKILPEILSGTKRDIFILPESVIEAEAEQVMAHYRNLVKARIASLMDA